MNGLKRNLAKAFDELISVVNEDSHLKDDPDLVDSIMNLRAYVGAVVCLYDENDPDNTDLDIKLDSIDEL